MRKDVDRQLGEAYQKIEDGLIPKGPNVVRHLSIPPNGKSPEWILEEMDHMDKEKGGHANWEGGRMSGAVYRTSALFVYFTLVMTWECIFRRRRGHGESYSWCFP